MLNWFSSYYQLYYIFSGQWKVRKSLFYSWMVIIICVSVTWWFVVSPTGTCTPWITPCYGNASCKYSSSSQCIIFFFRMSPVQLLFWKKNQACAGIFNLLWVYLELTKWPTPRWLVSSVGRVLHRYHRGHRVRIPYRPDFFPGFLFTTA